MHLSHVHALQRTVGLLPAEVVHNEEGVDAPRLGSEGGVRGPEMAALRECRVRPSLRASDTNDEYGLV